MTGYVHTLRVQVLLQHWPPPVHAAPLGSLQLPACWEPGGQQTLLPAQVTAVVQPLPHLQVEALPPVPAQQTCVAA